MRIDVRGATENNLEDVDVELGPGLTVVTGVSGSGKSTLVFDTIYHEAHRRMLQALSLSSHASAPAAVRSILGLGPAVAVGQNLLNRNPNSTVATVSGLHPFFRLLFARFGERVCPTCGTEISVHTPDQILAIARTLADTGSAVLRATLVHRGRGSYATLLNRLDELGLASRLRIDGGPWDGRSLSATQHHELELRMLTAGPETETSQIRAALVEAFSLGAYAVSLETAEERRVLSRASVCTSCGRWFRDLEPSHFNRACPLCEGSGCAACAETGLPAEAATVRYARRRFTELARMSVEQTDGLFRSRSPLPQENRLYEEILRRTGALVDVGLGYVSLDRPAPTLSRGEAQRLRLSVSLVSRLEDMLHVLDEPTVGLHPADVGRLIPVLRRLGGPVVYVEHDREAALAADRAVDLGPGAGTQGGRITYAGDVPGLLASDTTTGLFFSGRRRVPLPKARASAERFLTFRGASARNLADVDIRIPLERLTVIAGVSGSGKSTFVEEVLVPSLPSGKARNCRCVEGAEHVRRVTLVDQDPIGTSPRSNPATYTKLSDTVRDLFAQKTGLSPSHFSFNRPEGACPTCKGIGAVEVSLRYLPSTWVACDDCGGRRFGPEVLDARISLGNRELSIAHVYELSVADARGLFAEDTGIPPQLRRKMLPLLDALAAIGLGYMPLGQPSPSLSGGEAQRVKLAKYLGRGNPAGHLVVLDEPSTGLHPADLSGIVGVLRGLADRGATVVVVEHAPDVVAAADWVVDLGPGAGPAGGRVVAHGTPIDVSRCEASSTGHALRRHAAHRSIPANRTPEADEATGKSTDAIRICGASANNLRGVSVAIPKSRFTVVTGVSGSGKSSLVSDVLEAEARRRYLESLSMYERQGTHEGPEVQADSIAGIGVTMALGSGRSMHNPRSTVGTATELSRLLQALFAGLGSRNCPCCGEPMVRAGAFECPACGHRVPIPDSRLFSPAVYAAACTCCHGVGHLRRPEPGKLIVHPSKPLCGGAMHSPGFFPKGYLCKAGNGGYDMMQALAQRYGFDTARTPWNQMSLKAQEAFLYGDPEPLTVLYRSKSGRTRTTTVRFPGFYGFVGDWDTGGTYTSTRRCPECGGRRLRPQYLAVTLAHRNISELSAMTVGQLREELRDLSAPAHAGGSAVIASALETVRRRLSFLESVGLGYVSLDQPSASLSAGEAQRVRLSALLGSELTGLTVLLDEPSRGMHPRELDGLVQCLEELRDAGNTVIVVEHEMAVVRRADHIIDMGPGAGARGGRVVAEGTPRDIVKAGTATGFHLSGQFPFPIPRTRRDPRSRLEVIGARENNLKNVDVSLPLGVLVGVCGVSGSGKSTLVVDTIGRALAPKKHTVSVSREPIEPGAHDEIRGVPSRVVVVDQSTAGLHSPASFLGVDTRLRRVYVSSPERLALSISEEDVSRRCDACGGSGGRSLDMGFLPSVYVPCDVCGGSGFASEAEALTVEGLSLPQVYSLTLTEVADRFAGHERLAAALAPALRVGLGYLVLGQRGKCLSGGEAQRLKIARELGRRTAGDTLYLMDEPTVGQHLSDVAVLVRVLHDLVESGASVVVVDHHLHLLASCDWLVELGPGGGDAGGSILTSGTPEQVAVASTPTAGYLAAVLEGNS